MKWTWSVLFTAALIEMHGAPRADACGVKLTIGSKSPRKAVARSSNPTTVLLLGSPPHQLQRDLSAAGHHVDVARDAGSAKRKSYTVVIADRELEGSARSQFHDSIIIVRTADVSQDLHLVENQVARRPVDAADRGTVVAAREARQPIAAGPKQEPARKVVAAIEPKEAVTEPAAAPPRTEKPPVRVEKAPPRTEKAPIEKAPPVKPEPVRVATAVKPPVEDRPAVAPPVAKPKAAAAQVLANEIFFGLDGADGGARGNATITKTARWLTDNADIKVVIEGYADPTGDAGYNQTLAQKRADWAYQALITAGIDASRLEVISYGSTRLKYSAADGRNRRIAIVPKAP